MIGVGEDLNRKAELVLVEPPYKLQSDPNDHHAKHVVFGSNDMKYMASILRDLIEAGAYRYV